MLGLGSPFQALEGDCSLVLERHRLEGLAIFFTFAGLSGVPRHLRVGRNELRLKSLGH